MITALDLARKQRSAEINLGNKVCIHGYPGVGKTVFAATIAKIPTITRVLWADLEDGISAVLSATNPDGSPYFTDDELAKILYMPIQDRTKLDTRTAELVGLTSGSGTTTTKGKIGSYEAAPAMNAQAAKILLPHLLNEAPVHYDTVQRKHVLRANENTVSWHLSGLTESDALVIDSGSQLGQSIYSLGIEANDNHNNSIKHWGEFTTNALAVLAALQAARCAVVFVCHTLAIEEDKETKRKSRILPWFGSGPFSAKVGHYFGTVLYMYTDTGYRSVSTPVSRATVMAKSRNGINSALIPNPSMQDILGQTDAAKAAKIHIGGTKQPQAQQPKPQPQPQPQSQPQTANKPQLLRR